MLKRRSLLGFAVSLALSFAACSPAHPHASVTDAGNPDSGGVIETVRLVIEPSNAVLFLDTACSPASAATQDFTAALKHSDGTSEDWTASTVFSLSDTSIGAFDHNRFTSTTALPGAKAGLTTTVSASSGSRSANANLTLAALRVGKCSGASDPDKRDFFFVEPYQEAPSPQKDILKFGTQIKQVDVAFSIDTTISMNNAIEDIRRGLADPVNGLLAKLTAAIPDVQIAVAEHRDYPVNPYGNFSDFPVRVPQILTSDLTSAQNAVNGLVAMGGSDTPESQIASMWYILTGREILWSGGSVPAHVPAANRFGGVDFRPGALPVVVEVTDTDWHDASDYENLGYAPPSLNQLKEEFVRANAKFIDITDVLLPEYVANANILSDYTGSSIPPAAFDHPCQVTVFGPCCTGANGEGQPADGPDYGAGKTCRLNFIHEAGKGVSDSVVKAIEAISKANIFDITADAENDPTNQDGIDAKPFIKALRAVEEGNASAGCAPMTGQVKDTDGDGVADTFVRITVGTPVCFEVIPATNTTVRGKTQAVFVNAFIRVLGMPGRVNLDRRQVIFLIPPTEQGPG